MKTNEKHFSFIFWSNPEPNETSIEINSQLEDRILEKREKQSFLSIVINS